MYCITLGEGGGGSKEVLRIVTDGWEELGHVLRNFIIKIILILFHSFKKNFPVRPILQNKKIKN